MSSSLCVCGKTLLITSGTNHQGRQPLVDRFMTWRKSFQSEESLWSSLGRWVGGRISIHLYFKLPPSQRKTSSFLPFCSELEVSVSELATASPHPTPLVMLYHNFLIGFSSLLISWLFKQQTHADNSPVECIIIMCIIIYRSLTARWRSLVDSPGFRPAFWLPMSGNDSRRLRHSVLCPPPWNCSI